MSERLRFSALGAELPERFLAALARLLALQPAVLPQATADLAATRGWLSEQRSRFDQAALRQLHRALEALGEPAQWRALGLSDADAERIDTLAAELGTALEAAANIGKTIGRLAAHGD